MAVEDRWTAGEHGRVRYASRGSWDLLLVCTAALLLTAVARLHLLFPAVGVLRPVMVSGVAATALYLLDVHPARRLAALWSPVTACLLGLLLWVALSVPTALREARSFTFLVDDFAKTAVLFALVAGAVRGPGDVRRLAFLYFLGAALYGAIVLARFDVGPGSWRLQNLYTYDPNDFATFAVTAMPLGLYFLVWPGGRFARLTALLGCAVLGATFVWAGSRGGFLAFLGMTAFLLVRYRAIPLRRRLLGTGLLAVVIALVASDRYWDQMSTLLTPEDDYNITAETGRLNVWKRGLGYMLDRPAFGVGANNFPVAEGVISPLAELQQYGIGVRWTAPHNSFVQVGAELGMPGLILLLALLVSTFRALRRVERRPPAEETGEPDLRPLAQTLTGSLVGFVIGGFFLSLAYSPMLYTLAALAVALDKVTVTASRARTPTTTGGAHRAARASAGITRPPRRSTVE